MHKKVKSLLVAGVLAINAIGSTVSVFADSTSKTTNSTQIETKEVSTDGWITTTSKSDLNKYWDYSEVEKEGKDVIVLQNYKGGSSNPKVIIPREVDGKRVELLGLNSKMFSGVTHIKVAEGEGQKVKINTESLKFAFSNNSNLQYVDFSGLDTTGLTDIHNIFANCKNLKYINLDGWDVTKVTDIRNMFYDSSNLDTLNLSGWKLSDKCTYISGVIANTSKLKNIVLKDSKKKILDVIRPLFNETTKQLSLDVTNLDLSGTNSASNLFSSKAIAEIKGLDTLNTSNIKYMDNMFAESNVKELDLSNWDTENVKSMSNMFKNCSNLSKLYIGNWNTLNVNDMSYMFSNCSSLTKLDVSDLDTQNVKNMSYMFSNCSSLVVLDVKNWNTGRVRNMSYMFHGCDDLTVLDVSNWDTDMLMDPSYMFSGCKNLVTLDVSKWIVSKVNTTEGMFSDCNSLKRLNLSRWVTGSLKTTKSMFAGCYKLNKLDLTGINMFMVTDTSYMFDRCTSLTEINGTKNWKLDKVTKTKNMFYNTKLTNIDLSNANLFTLNKLVWSDFSKVFDAIDMFGNTNGGEVKVKTSDELLSFYDDTETTINGHVTTVKVGPNVF